MTPDELKKWASLLSPSPVGLKLTLL
jgi:hypothetical protein